MALPFSVNVNDQPVIAPPVPLDLGTEIPTPVTFTIPVSEFLANASDPDTPLTLLGPIDTGNSDVSAVIGATDVTFNVSNGFSGMLTLTYSVADAGSPQASTETTAALDVAGLIFLTDSGLTVADPDSNTLTLLDDSTDGSAATTDIAVGTNAAEAVVYQELIDQGVSATPYPEIEGFGLLGGNDLLDLRGTSRDFLLDGGAGDDWIYGGDGNDTLSGGDGQDTLAGGGGMDRFDAGDSLPAIADVISDYQAGEVIDLTGLITLQAGESLADRARLENGDVIVTDSANTDTTVFAVTADGGGLPSDVTVAFQDEANMQQVQTI
jgi:Ca2+-binding RTX toxin-like protein